MYLYTYYIVYVKGKVGIKKSFKTPDFSERSKEKYIVQTSCIMIK